VRPLSRARATQHASAHGRTRGARVLCLQPGLLRAARARRWARGAHTQLRAGVDRSRACFCARARASAVVEAYSESWGPCGSVAPLLRKFLLEAAPPHDALQVLVVRRPRSTAAPTRAHALSLP
jgi:hypothetical protein